MTVSHRLAAFASPFLFALAACSGGGAVVGSGGPAPHSGATATPVAGASATPGSRPTATPVPTATPTTGSQAGTIAPPTSPPTAPATTSAAVPATPAPGQCRTGQVYSEYITTNDAAADTEAFTVFEPAQLCNGATYPLVMWGPGWDGSRQSSLASNPIQSEANVLSPGNIASLVNAGYGVVSIDERGFGEDGGTATVMDPNYEGYMDLSVMDWAQANLNWIKYGPTIEGDDQHEPVMGAIGGSYGSMYQKMLLNLDKRHRLHALVPQVGPHDLNYSLFPNGVVKSAWDLALFGAGETGGSTATGYAHENPFLQTAVVGSIEANAESTSVHDFFAYHSSRYFCDQSSVATDGTLGNPIFGATKPPKINALLFQGIRDTLFNMSDAYGDYQCWSQGGGDVRLLSYMAGHNSLQVVPDPYLTLYYSGPTADLSFNCGTTNVDTATVAFFDQYLKGIANAAAAVPTMPCFTIDAGDAVLTPTILSGKSTTEFAVATTTAVAGSAPDVPTAITLGPAFTTPAVIAGFPHMTVTVTPVAATGEPILYFGIGQMHANKPGAWDLLDNQLTPIRGTGTFDLDMTGVAARVAAGDQLALLVFGEEDQYDATGDVNVAKPTVVPVTVGGNVWIPFASNAVTAP